MRHNVYGALSFSFIKFHPIPCVLTKFVYERDFRLGLVSEAERKIAVDFSLFVSVVILVYSFTDLCKILVE